MILFDAMRKAKIGDRLINNKLKIDIEWYGSIWEIPRGAYNLKYPGWEIIDYMQTFDGVKG